MAHRSWHLPFGPRGFPPFRSGRFVSGIASSAAIKFTQRASICLHFANLVAQFLPLFTAQ